MRSGFARKKGLPGNGGKASPGESQKQFTLYKNASPPLFIDEARKTDKSLDSELKFIENLSGKPFREGMKIVVCELISKAIPVAGVNSSDKDKTIYLIKIPEGKSGMHNFLNASGGLVRLHELVHAQCDVFGNGNPKRTFLRLAYSEGLATFGECQFLGSKSPLKVHTVLAQMALLVEGVCTYVLANGAVSLVHDLMLPAHDLKHKLGIAAVFAINILYLGLTAVLGLVGGLLLQNQLRYVLFTRSLDKLANEVGDGPAAFRIALAKEPKAWKDLLFPLKFYKEEIAAAKEKKAAESAPA